MSSSIDINGAGTLSGRIYESRAQPWYAEVVVDTEEDKIPSEQAILSFFGELDFGGFINPKRTVVDNGRATIRLDAGSGLLNEKQASQSFHRTTVGGVLNALVYLTGDAIDPESVKLDHELRAWTWGNTFGVAALHSLAAAAGCSWRMTRAGAILFVEETWPELDPGFEYVQLEEHPGQTIILPDGLPLVRPGVTFQGRRVSEVITSWTAGENGSLQQQVVWEQSQSPTKFGTSIQVGTVDWIERTKGQEIDLSKEYPCEVVGQSADRRTVDVIPDDEVIKGTGLQNVPLRFGAPGLTPRLKNGARCHLGWEAADPQRPYCALFEADGIIEYIVEPDSGADITLRARGAGNVNISAETGASVNINGDVKVNGGALEVAHKYSLVSMGLPTTTTPGVTCGPPIPGAPAQLGIVVSGFPNFKGG